MRPREAEVLDRARDAVDRGAWDEAYAVLAAADAEGGLGPAALEEMAVAALMLGIPGLVGGFVALPLLGAVLAITLAPTRRGLAVAGMVCGIVALALWIPVILAAAVTRS